MKQTIQFSVLLWFVIDFQRNVQQFCLVLYLLNCKLRTQFSVIDTLLSGTEIYRYIFYMARGYS